MPYNLAEAGAATGKSKSTILRSIRKGLISAQRVEPGGGWAIEPVELHRAFRPVANDAMRTGNGTAETATLRAQLDDRDTTIRDLRNRLDASEAERRTVQAQLTALLTDQRPRPWWRRWR